ncbi:MAG: putative ribonuclease III [Candidatus Peregrinibacteria bacterium Greene0416_62]|nr:MAG: putative ribonuclease III [Candidatus Peregrinibacteria bacterium Greene0416_62]TSD00378.1 MAG: putative ribonuclease III [Candidatus Peregrinibacteria bacterium Greene1014_49]
MPPAPLVSLEKTIGVSFRDKEILVEALTHRSAVRRSGLKKHNERFEFLGDAVLELVATEYLFRVSDKPEGDLTNYRSALVNGEHLASVAKEMKLGEYLHLSRGEEASGGRDKSSTLANALEALIGAIYLDQGFDGAERFCREFILVRLRELLAAGKDRDEKSMFQEKAQKVCGTTPHYEVVSEEGPDHDKKFLSAAFIGEEKIAEGSGSSKQRAELDAAKAALKVKKWA